MPRSTNRRTTTATRRNAEPRGKPEVDEVDDVEDTATPSRKRRKVSVLSLEDQLGVISHTLEVSIHSVCSHSASGQ